MLESLCLHFFPNLSPIIMYATTTCALFYSFYGTPWITFQILEREKFYLKSKREQSFVRRLVLQLIFVVILVPMTFNWLIVTQSPAGFREYPSPENIDAKVDVFPTT